MNFEGSVGSPHTKNEKYEGGAAVDEFFLPVTLDIINSVKEKWKLKNKKIKLKN